MVPPYYSRTRLATAAAAVASATEVANTAAAVNSTGMDLDLPVDPNEPTYCFCNQVSFGEMIGCDNHNVCNSLPMIFAFIFWK